jgi:excisionase family DNA binding protein
MEPLALRISEAARCCGVSRYVIYDLINAGKIPVIKREGPRQRH